MLQKHMDNTDRDRRQNGREEGSSAVQQQEEVDFIRQKCNSLSMRGQYPECIRLAEQNMEKLYQMDRWLENFYSVLKLHRRCYPSLNKSQGYEEYLTEQLKKRNIPWIFASLTRGTGAQISWTAEYFRKLCEEYRDKEEPEAALSCMDVAAKLDPTNSVNYLAKAQLLEALGRDSEALAMLQQALELNSANYQASSQLALHYLKSDKKKAMEYIEKAISAAPGEPGFYAVKAKILAEDGNLIDAVACYTEAARLDPMQVEYPYEKGMLLLRQGKEGPAVAQFMIAAELDARHTPSLNQLVELLFQSQPDKALTYANTLTLLEPENTAAMLRRGDLLRRLGDPVAAERQYKKVLRADESLAAPYGRLGELYREEDEEKALLFFGRAVERAPKESVYRLGKAAVLCRLDRTEEAVAEYKAVVEADPACAEAYGALGDLHRDTQPDAALDYYDKAAELDPQSAHYERGKGELLMGKGEDLERALRHMTRAVELDPGNAGLHLSMALLLERTGKVMSALDHCKRAVNIDPMQGGAFALMARLLVDTRPWEALGYVGTAIHLDATNGEYYYSKALVLSHLGAETRLIGMLRQYVGEGRYSGDEAELSQVLEGQGAQLAIMYINRAIELAPQKQEYVYLRARLFHLAGESEKAKAQYREFLKAEPGDHRAHYGLAQILMEEGDQKALEHLDSAIALRPQEPDYHAARGDFLAMNPDTYRDALESFDRAIQLDRLAWRAILAKAHLLEALGDELEALVHFRRVLLQRPEYLEALVGSARLYLDERPAVSLVYFEKATALDPDNYRLWAWRAKVLCRLGRLEEAQAAIGRVQQLCPDVEKACKLLADILCDVSPDTALGFVERALELNPGSAPPYVLLGNVHMARQSREEAEACYRRALELDPGKAEPWARLAAILFGRGDVGCVEAVDRAVQLEPHNGGYLLAKARYLRELAEAQEGEAPHTEELLELAQKGLEQNPDSLAFQELLVELLGRKKTWLLRRMKEKRRLAQLQKRREAALAEVREAAPGTEEPQEDAGGGEPEAPEGPDQGAVPAQGE